MDLLNKPENGFLRRMLFAFLFIAFLSNLGTQILLRRSGLDLAEYNAAWNGFDEALINDFNSGLLESGGFGDYASAQGIDYVNMSALMGFCLCAMILLVRKQQAPPARKKSLLRLSWLAPSVFILDVGETTLITATLRDPLSVPRAVALLHPVFYYAAVTILFAEMVVMIALAAGPIRAYFQRRARSRRRPRE
jgi:hypothetical protein